MPRVDQMRAVVGLYSLPKRATAPNPMYEFDVDGFRDPQGQKAFIGLDGRDGLVQTWMRTDPKLPSVIHAVKLLVTDIVGAQKARWLSIGFRDYHGKWIAPAIVEIIANELEKDYEVGVLHVGI